MNVAANNAGAATTRRPELQAPLKNERNSVPGQQIGLYSDNEEKDVCQMTRTLNNPGETSQEDRG